MKLGRYFGWRSILSGLVCALVGPGALASPSYSQVIGFGDSLSDVGNSAIMSEAAGLPLLPNRFDAATFPSLVPSAAYSTSRKFTNVGPVWSEAIAEQLGVEFRPSLEGGTGYAVGGANSVDDLGPLVPAEAVIPSVSEQISGFINEVGGAAPSDALYTITAGGNDLRDALTYTTSLSELNDVLERSIAAVVNMVVSLGAAGANDIVLLNVPSLGLAPQVSLLDTMGMIDADNASTLTAVYNTSLEAALSGQLALLGMDLDLTIFDASGLLTDVVADPASFGFNNAVDTCVDHAIDSPCDSPNDYVFWDGLHPTAAMHQLVAEQVMASLPQFNGVPSPGVLFLLLGGAIGMRVVRGTG